MKSFTNKVAAITGAGSGIGQALAFELAKAGANLALSDVNEANLASTVTQSKAHGVTVKHYRLDVSSRDAIYAHAEEVVRDFGKVNMIINNAGVAVHSSIQELRDEDFHWLMNINFWGMVHGTRAFLPHLIASGEGHVVNLSSIFGMVAVPKQGAYNASKFGIRGFTEALRQELKLDKVPVGVSCVHPGGVKTNIARAARKGTSDATNDIATPFEQFALTTPTQAARIILHGVKCNRGRIFVGRDARVIDLLQRIMGWRYESIVGPTYEARMKAAAQGKPWGLRARLAGLFKRSASS